MKKGIEMKNVYLKSQSQAIIIMIFLSLSLLVFFPGCGTFLTLHTQTIAPSVDIETTWKEIKIDPPVKAVKSIQNICIEMQNIKKWNINGMENYSIDPDGNQVKIEIQLFNTEGKSFTLNTISLGSAMCFSYLSEDRDKDLSVESRFPPGMKFEKLLIRANKNIKAGEVKWVCTTSF